ncbi:IS66 family transposase [Halodesulfovibrio aestuarii]|uniref:Transposase n=1 Tax=Halodesulfovibrio aestuarii TaxID=126333 RepID=A0A8G2C989_9BACT|nr:IS66 family transposase [Halodesulfovibrio aestuarii]SHJ05595.1 Transposase [Halodesulfovibrio aestuarii]
MNISALPHDPEELKQLVVSFQTRLAEQNSLIEILQEQVRLLKAMQFTKSSEQQKKPAKDEDQYCLFDEAEFAASDDKPAEPEQIEVPSHTRAKRGRKPIPANIPRVDIVHDIPEEKKTCPCGCTLTRIGEEISEKLDIIPQKIQVIRHIRPKYACKECEGATSEGLSPTVKIAPMPPQLFKQGIATPGLLAYILVNKFCDGLPFYRQTSMFARLGIDIPRSTMSNWAMLAAKACAPLQDAMYARLHQSDIINMDETTVQVLDEHDRKNTSKSYMWVCRGGSSDTPVVLFRYSPSRAGEVATQMLGDFKGYLQVDGYVGYNALGENDHITRVGCLAHVRRKFMDVLKAGSNKKKGVASRAVALIKDIYKLESAAQKKKFSSDAIQALREEKVTLLLAKLKELCTDAVLRTPPKSLLGIAISYTMKQLPYVENYVKDPRLAPDNNIAENAIRPFAVGRKNWLFSGSPAGAHASAFLYSLVESAKAADLNPYEYLLHVFEKMPNATTPDDIEKLLPVRGMLLTTE